MDDIADWLLHLETLVHFFELKGLEYERVSALNLLMRVHEMACPLQTTSLISTLSMLGSQYARLGHSSQAGLVLQRGTYSTRELIHAQYPDLGTWRKNVPVQCWERVAS